MKLIYAVQDYLERLERADNMVADRIYLEFKEKVRKYRITHNEVSLKHFQSIICCYDGYPDNLLTIACHTKNFVNSVKDDNVRNMLIHIFELPFDC